MSRKKGPILTVFGLSLKVYGVGNRRTSSLSSFTRLRLDHRRQGRNTTPFKTDSDVNESMKGRPSCNVKTLDDIETQYVTLSLVEEKS